MSFSEKNALNVNTDSEATLKALMRERIVIMDGAMGTMLQQEKLDEKDFAGEKRTDIRASIREKIANAKTNGIELKGNNELLSITQPEIIKSVHQKFLSVGADMSFISPHHMLRVFMVIIFAGILHKIIKQNL